MPSIIDYELVLAQMEAAGFKCHYFNSGAFGFVDAGARSIAWVGPADDTITPAARPLVRRVAPPYEASLAALAARAWQENVGGRAWVMPMSHWAYELMHGSREWLATMIESIGLDPAGLWGRNNAAAVEFSASEAAAFARFVQCLLEKLDGSDFLLTFPARPILCTIHHHKQLWWTSPDEKFLAALEALAPL